MVKETNDRDIDVLKMLFEEHHRQLVAKRQKIHGTTEKSLAAFIVIAGWLVMGKDSMTNGLHWVIIGVAVVLAIVSCKNVHTNNRSYYKVARVIGRINKALNLCETGHYGLEESIYSNGWKHFGETGEFKGWFYHVLVITAGVVLCVIAALMKAS